MSSIQMTEKCQPSISVATLQSSTDRHNMLIIFLLFDLLRPISSSFSAKITGCTASENQADYHCAESIDGDYVVGWVDAANGWAFNGQLPSNVEYDIEKPYLLTQIRILTGIDRPNHMITNFLLEVIAKSLVK